MFRLYIAILFVALGACAPRAQLVFAPNVAAGNPVRSVFIGTTRVPQGAGYSSHRSIRPSYLRYDIAVPPLRLPGAIDVPRKATIDPQTQFVATGRTIYPDPGAFRRDLRLALNRRAGADREAVIYVHGFNNTFDEGVLRITQLAEDFELPGVAVHYSWPSAGNPLGYAYDRDSLLISRDGLETLIRDVRAAGARRIILVAHSVGSMLIMETLRQLAIAEPGSAARIIDAVILISPDLDVELFRSQAARIGKLPQPFGIFVSQRDKVLSLSARLTGQRNRLGNVQSIEELADLDVTVVDVTEFSTGAGHFTAGSSAAVISIFGRAGALEAAFSRDSAGRTGLFPGTVLTVQNATSIILSPVTALAGAAAQ
ncbi:MAG: alpha/beta fold hydrolase [Rhodobacter sp.]|nr:alpha/beta fold hydrolase [Rhodobacter sp.]